jgi:hypothetical protein
LVTFDLMCLVIIFMLWVLSDVEQTLRFSESGQRQQRVRSVADLRAHWQLTTLFESRDMARHDWLAGATERT